MKNRRNIVAGFGLSVVMFGAMTGCHRHGIIEPAPYPPIGSVIDQMNEAQEQNAEAAKFVIYMHEFEASVPEEKIRNVQAWRLNDYGEDHVKQIAAKLKEGVAFPVVIERSETSVDPRSTYKYPVHFNDEIDERRRQVVVSALVHMGIDDAENRVVVAPSFSEGLNAQEAATSYGRSRIGNGGGYGGGYGGGFGGGFGGGGFGGGGGFF
ncbi:hypothetical protein LOC68_23020 [Blastopirellula sp. JC732]|uniref:Uncharacterized protein n=1 Tax=Blastopirellula sediminis TaxID=2894196 RepID=A0A9X1MR99_9BACT|nr:hypothetical protein [Blastopirellula sediminis]MCC9605424.1 hypothetical protein [Blastopirellula sediminis]MCC9631276.1 hypothetical protein [Blastopirellula sediminis]